MLNYLLKDVITVQVTIFVTRQVIYV